MIAGVSKVLRYPRFSDSTPRRCRGHNRVLLLVTNSETADREQDRSLGSAAAKRQSSAESLTGFCEAVSSIQLIEMLPYVVNAMVRDT